MSELESQFDARGDRLLDQLTKFSQALHRVGLPVTPDKLINAVTAVSTVGIDSRRDFYWTLHAVFVNQPDQSELFEQVFYLFWRDPGALGRVPDGTPLLDEDVARLSRRVLEALMSDRVQARSSQESSREIDARLSWSRDERLRTKDFEMMSAEELAQAQRAVRDMTVPVKVSPSRRFRAHYRGSRIDMRRTMRALLRAGPGTIPLVKQRRRQQHPPLVMLCDISGSMATYTSIFLHFAHAMSHRYSRVSTFLFATRLSNITRQLRHEDIDCALEHVGRVVEDWDGGTRIGACLSEFNHDWSRRVLAQNATVILVTDGLDREVDDGLANQMERLHKSCRKLIWLNPLLRYDAFQPLAHGIEMMLPFVDEFRSVHNLQSVSELANVLSR